MELVTFESNAYKHLVKRLENIEMMLLENTKLIKQQENTGGNFPEFISRENASEEFQISLTTVDKKVRKFAVSRLQSGGKNLINRLEFIKALQNPDPFTKVINSQKKGGEKSNPSGNPQQ